MGADALAIVDRDFREYGVESARVVAAPVVPQARAGDLNSPTIMCAKRTADLAQRQMILFGAKRLPSATSAPLIALAH